jgi:hypothetical protein
MLLAGVGRVLTLRGLLWLCGFALLREYRKRKQQRRGDDQIS